MKATTKQGYHVDVRKTSWPESLPSSQEGQIMSVFCGDTGLHWALHRGAAFQFKPSCCWRTGLIDDDELRDSGPSWLILSRHLPEAALKLVFGDADEPMLSGAMEVSRLRKIPIISVYILATDEQQPRKLAYCFHELPARLFLFQPDDFFTIAQGRHETMGVDRIAALKAVTVLHGSPCLVFDGGRLMSWLCSFPNSKERTDGEGGVAPHIYGGGMGLGVLQSLKCLLKYAQHTQESSDDASDLRDKLIDAVEDGELLELFTHDRASSMVMQLLTNLTMGARHVIREFLLKAQRYRTGMQEEHSCADAAVQSTRQRFSITLLGPTTESNVVVTEAEGTDTVFGSTGDAIDECKEPNANEDGEEEDEVPKIMVVGDDAAILEKILSWDHNGLFPQDAAIPEYNVQTSKFLWTYAITFEIQNRFQQQERQGCLQLDSFLLGKRIAKEFCHQPDRDGDIIYRGTIMAAVDEASDGSDVTYFVQYDDQDIEHQGLVEIYVGLTLFSRVGEKQLNDPPKDVLLASQDKQAASQSAVEALISKRRDVHVRAQAMQEQAAKARKPAEAGIDKSKQAAGEIEQPSQGVAVSVAAGVRSRGTRSSPRTKPAQQHRRGHETPKSQTRKRRRHDDPHRLINSRVAKCYGRDIYSGIVVGYNDDEGMGFWQVSYDDGDEEEFDEDDMDAALALYSKHRKRFLI